MSTVKTNNVQVGQSATATNNFTLYQPAVPDGTVRLGNGNSGAATDVLTVTSGGNLGLGVTPSAWSSNLKAIDINNAGAISGTSGTDLNILSNAYEYSASAWKYKTSATAARYNMVSGNHLWYTAPSGTAGNPITFTQAMTLDASGSLSVGQRIKATGNAAPATGSGPELFWDGTTSGVLSFNRSGGAYLPITLDGSEVRFSTSSTERARIDSLGDLKVPHTYLNTTAAAANMHIDSAGYHYRSTSSLKYKTAVEDSVHGLAEVMRLRAVTYKGKTDGDTVYGGLIAEEVHDAGLTEFVQYADDGTPDALAYGNMVSLAFKAIQEQQAIITELRSRIEALEAK